MRRFLIVLLLVVTGIPAITWIANRTKEEEPVAAFALRANIDLEGNAEIVAASPDGRWLVSANTELGRIDLIDFAEPTEASLATFIELPGEPTSVAVSPDGFWAVASLHLSPAKKGEVPPDPDLPGGLALIDLREAGVPRRAAIIGIGHQPDSIAVTQLGRDLIVLLAIENEPMIVADGVVTDAGGPGDPNDRSAPGAVQVVTLNPYKPGDYALATLDLPEQVLAEAGLLFPDDPQPEFVALSPDRSLAAVSLQENNGIVVFDPYTREIRQIFSTGRASERVADLRADTTVQFVDTYPGEVATEVAGDLAGLRFPDGIAFSSTADVILSADEGELPMTGGRGFSLWDTNGTFLWDDAGGTERVAAEQGLYLDSRSAERGIEIEAVAAGRFGQKEYAFAVAERGGFMAVYDITNPQAPVFVSLHGTGASPESVTVIEDRGLVVVGDEDAGRIRVFAHSTAPL